MKGNPFAFCVHSQWQQPMSTKGRRENGTHQSSTGMELLWLPLFWLFDIRAINAFVGLDSEPSHFIDFNAPLHIKNTEMNHAFVCQSRKFYSLANE